MLDLSDGPRVVQMPDGSDVDGHEAFELRIRRELQQVILTCTPQSLWQDLRSKARSIYPNSYDSNRNDSRLLQDQIGFKTIHDRHFFMDRVLSDCGRDSRCLPFPKVIKINRWRYTQISCGWFNATQKYVRTPDDMPIKAKFRETLARAGRLRRQTELFQGEDVEPKDTGVYNAIVIHGPISCNPLKDEFRDNGFINLAFPYDDCLAWAANFTLDEIISWYNNQAIGVPKGGELPPGGPPEGLGPTPVWKIPPKRME